MGFKGFNSYSHDLMAQLCLLTKSPPLDPHLMCREGRRRCSAGWWQWVLRAVQVALPAALGSVFSYQH